MAFTLNDADAVLRRARQFYKGGFKSSNKMYVNVSTPKKLYRNLNAQAADVYLNQYRNYKALHGLQNLRSYGEYLVSKDLKSGNCMEMSAVAIYHLRSIASPESVRVYEANANVHSFILAFDENADFDEEASTVAQMSQARMHGVHVIDVWMNTACSANDYFNRSFQKLMQWQEQGKTIRSSIQDGPDGAPLPVGIDVRRWHHTMAHHELDYSEE